MYIIRLNFAQLLVFLVIAALILNSARKPLRGSSFSILDERCGRFAEIRGHFLAVYFAVEQKHRLALSPELLLPWKNAGSTDPENPAPTLTSAVNSPDLSLELLINVVVD